MCSVRGCKSARVCVLCKGDKTHCALDSDCSAKLTVKVRAKQIYNSRPTRFRETRTNPVIVPQQESMQTQALITTSTAGPCLQHEQTLGSEVEEEGYILVSFNISKRKRAIS